MARMYGEKSIALECIDNTYVMLYEHYEALKTHTIPPKARDNGYNYSH